MKTVYIDLFAGLLCFAACEGNNGINGNTDPESNLSSFTSQADSSVTNATKSTAIYTYTSLQTIGKIEKYDDELDSLLAVNAEIEILAEGFTWAEGPVWVEDGEYILFSDVPENRVYKWKEGEEVSVYLEPSGYSGEGYYSYEPGSNGLVIRDGKLVLCQHGDRRIAEMINDLGDPSSEFISVADNYEGKKFNSPNDLAVCNDGSIYFTDPPYGLPDKENDSSRELDYFGVFKVDPEGEVTLLTDELTRPNGIAFSPDYSICYVNVSDNMNAVTMAYDINENDGTFENGRIFFNATSLIPGRPGLPDGMKVHSDGYIFATGPGGVLILSPEGKHLGTINTTQATANCVFNSDYSYLYITADYYLLRVKLGPKEIINCL
jgi:gluconolactonase